MDIREVFYFWYLTSSFSLWIDLCTSSTLYYLTNIYLHRIGAHYICYCIILIHITNTSIRDPTLLCRCIRWAGYLATLRRELPYVVTLPKSYAPCCDVGTRMPRCFLGSQPTLRRETHTPRCFLGSQPTLRRETRTSRCFLG